jgi:hypothetical protein
MVKHLKQNGCRTACQVAQPERPALKSQLGALAVEDRGSASRSRPCRPTGSDPAWYSTIWEKSEKLDFKSDYLNGLSERRQHFFDSLFYNVDLINKINNSLPLKANGSMEIFIGTGLNITLFPYFWDQLTPPGGDSCGVCARTWWR